MTRAIADDGIAGWYYRVLANGTVAVGDRYELVERQAGAPSLVRFWQLVHQHRPRYA